MDIFDCLMYYVPKRMDCDALAQTQFAEKTILLCTVFVHRYMRREGKFALEIGPLIISKGVLSLSGEVAPGGKSLIVIS